MTKAANLRRRLDTISAAMNDTFAMRLTKLTPNERSIYDVWRARLADHISRSDISPYERMMLGDQPPILGALSTKLHGPTPTITLEMTEADAAEAYRRFALGS